MIHLQAFQAGAAADHGTTSGCNTIRREPVMRGQIAIMAKRTETDRIYAPAPNQNNSSPTALETPKTKRAQLIVQNIHAVRTHLIHGFVNIFHCLSVASPWPSFNSRSRTDRPSYSSEQPESPPATKVNKTQQSQN
ncbi:hypothetical protein [Yoonia sp.]|uniref:hypothetical protein n=1 Tax=Yoonia sp. TaxID=2212373 RepID=UPI003F6CC783